MKQNVYYDFTKEFFTINGCLIEEKNAKHMKVLLTRQMDESLMNRPFYWHYMKKMNREGDPMSLSFKDISIGEEEEGIYLHAGTPKLQQIYQTALEKGYITRLYESINHPTHNLAMHPWLILNMKITFRGKQSKDKILSIGLNLINGAITHNMMELLEHIKLIQKISDYTFPMTPMIKLESAYNRIIQHVETYLTTLDTDWAEQSIQQFNYEKQLLQKFFHSDDIGEEQYQKELDQLAIRYKPRVTIKIANGGLFYLSVHTSQNLLT
ncbi:YqhG family protein [Halobacillus campisalis]|uniref:YqhG family protein n=1 Tax=Halobacillus campisalis TaxID=435909 RepID=A0ABW2K555_9BACI|nr:YqhG family protein [Halobacillus campisalis]